MSTEETSHREVIEDWLSNREQIIKMLRQMSEEYDGIDVHVRRSKVAGASISLVGAGMSVVGFGASFFTFGASAALGIAGAAVAASGGATTLGANIGDLVQKCRFRKERKLMIKRDRELMTRFQTLLNKKKLKPAEVLVTAKKGISPLTSAYSASSGAIKLVKSTCSSTTMFESLTKTAQQIHILGGVMTIVAIPLTMHELIESAAALSDKKKTKLSQEFLSLAEQLEDNLKECKNHLVGL